MDDLSMFMPKSHKERFLNNGEFIFQKQLEGIEAVDVEINGIKSRGVIYNHLNDMSTDKESRGFNVSLNTQIKKGDIVSFCEIGECRSYLVSSDIDNHYAYKTCTLVKCNHIIHLPNLQPMPCVGTDSSYGAKIFTGTIYSTERDVKLKLVIPRGNYGELLNHRIILDNDKYGIYKIGNVSVVQGGLYVLTLENDKYMEGLDDLETGIAFNGEISTQYEIIGSDSMKINKNNTYQIQPNCNCIFEVDMDTVNIVSQSNGECVLHSTISDEVFTLTAKLNNEIIDSKNIYTTRW